MAAPVPSPVHASSACVHGGPMTTRSVGVAPHLSIRSTERLAEAGAVPSAGPRGDSYDALVGSESVIALFKTERIRDRGTCMNLAASQILPSRRGWH